VLNQLWFFFFLSAFVAAIGQWLFVGDAEIFSRIIAAAFDMAALGAEIALGLIGVLCLWLGFFRVAEEAGVAARLSRLLTPLFRQLMPEVPANHPAISSVTMNLGANMLGLDNAATPLGLQAMRDLQSINPHKETASNAQILFLVLNTSSVTLLPVTVFLFRAQQGATEPALVFLPILLATTASTLAGLLLTAWIQKLNLFNRVVLGYAAGFVILLSTLMLVMVRLPSDQLASLSSALGNFLLLLVIMVFLFAGVRARVPVYEVFVQGARQGISVVIRIIPYLVAMLVAIGVFRASGVLDGLLWLVEHLCSAVGLDTRFVDALPTALMKPFSGSGARAMMLETMNNYGVDSFPALLAATIQGSTETTFYVLAVYFGSVGIKRVRYAIVCGLFADLVGILVAILSGYWFYSWAL